MAEENKDGSKGFVVKDRRHFDESGETRNPEESVAKTDKPEAGPDAQTGASSEAKDPRETEETTLPEINFAGFVFSLSSTAMYHFGDFPDPVTKEARRNLPAAKQTIDILSILQAKTQGNLDDDEKQLLDGILYELRMRYVKEMTHP